MTTVRIQQSPLLNNRFELPSDGLENIVKEYQKAWQVEGDKVVNGLEEVTGLTFTQPAIDVYIINPTAHGAIFHPLIIGGSYEPNHFVSILTHEVTHNLLTDNQQNENWHELAHQVFSQEDPFIARHVITHAVIEALYMDIFKDSDRIIRDLNFRESSPPHKKAWDIVTDRGYQDVIQKIRKRQPAQEKSHHSNLNQLKRVCTPSKSINAKHI